MTTWDKKFLAKKFPPKKFPAIKFPKLTHDPKSFRPKSFQKFIMVKFYFINKLSNIILNHIKYGKLRNGASKQNIRNYRN